MCLDTLKISVMIENDSNYVFREFETWIFSMVIHNTFFGTILEQHAGHRKIMGGERGKKYIINAYIWSPFKKKKSSIEDQRDSITVAQLTCK